MAPHFAYRTGLLGVVLLLTLLVLSSLAGVLVSGALPSSTGKISASSGSWSLSQHPRAAATYSVTFSDGFSLPANINWSVTFNGTTHTGNGTTNPAAFTVVNGTYSFSATGSKGYTPVPASGTVKVAGKAVRETIDFLPPGEYAITINEKGLATGTYWIVTFNGTARALTATSETVDERNGSYAYTISAPGYTPTPGSGTQAVAGASVDLNITFQAVHGQFQVAFTEAGIFATGDSWSVTYNGSNKGASVGVPILFAAGNGSWAFTVGAVVGFTASPFSGNVAVAGALATKTINFTVTAGYYEVQFRETGLAYPEPTWTVTFAGTPASTDTGRLAFVAQNGSQTFVVTPVPGYKADPASGSVLVAGQEVNQTIAFLTPGNYTLTFTEVGLPAGTRWTLNLTGFDIRETAPSPLVEVAPNGSYAWSVVPPTGWVATPPSGTVTIAGVDQLVTITFSPPVYALSFSEIGLPAASSWTVDLNGTLKSGTAGNLITFELVNGTYHYNFTAPAHYSAPSGNVTDSGGTSVSVTFTYTPPPPSVYSVTFNEVGLTTGTSWTVTFNGTQEKSTTSSVVFTGYRNDTYAYSIGALAGFKAATQVGTVDVSGATTVTVTFNVVHTDYTVTFTESGLASGITWSITCNNTPYSWSTSTGTSWTISLENGTYAYSITTPTGYTIVSGAASGSVTVAGGAVSAPEVTYTLASSGSSSSGSGILGSTTTLIIIVVVVLVVVVAVVALLMMRKKKPQAPTEAPYEGAPPYGQGGYYGPGQGPGGGPGYPPA